MINRNSLAFKNAITYFILFIIGIGLLGVLLLRNSTDEIILASEKQLIHSTELIKLKFEEQISELNQDIQYLAKSPLLNKYLTSQDESIKDLISREYLAILESKEIYAQIRFIGKEDNGRELIRAERKNGKTFIVEKDSLQSKGNRDYFIETITLPIDSFYLSYIDLNKEFGQISIPWTPTIRSACPVYLGDNSIGVIVINLDLSNLFNSLDQIVSDPGELRLVNSDGYYLYHYDSTKTFQFEFDKPSLFQNEFPHLEIANFDVSQKVNKVNNKIVFTNEINLPGSRYNLMSLVITDRSNILSNYYQWRNKSYALILGLGLLFMGITFYIISRQSNSLQDITSKIRSFPKTLKASNLPTHRKDEIGQLSLGFQEMTNLVRENMESLEQAKLLAENAVKEKEEFLENISHEIRNPLQSISGLTEIMFQNNKDKAQNELIKSLRFNTSNLNILINDLLDYKKVINGEIKLRAEWIDISDFSNELIKSNRFYAISKKNSLSLEIENKLNDHEIFIDRLRVSQVLNNLITNAIKFTSEGDIILSITTKKNGIEFSVKDTGTGLSQEEIQKINSRYYSGKNSNHITKGHGIGLTIVTQLLKTMNSELFVNSDYGKGSSFSFTLPVEHRLPSIKIEDQKSINNYLSDADILIIEDDEQINELYKHIFGSKVRNLEFINNLSDPPTLIDIAPDIIISDYKIANEGIKALHQILEKYKRKNNLLMIVSASNLNKNDFPKNLSIEKIIQKPFNSNELLDTVNELWILKYFGSPDFTRISEDYDHELPKIIKALNLLLDEWEKIKVTFVRSIQENNKQNILDIHHKIITSIRRLNLKTFEDYLEEYLSNMETYDNTKVARLVNHAFQFYIHEIEVEIEKATNSR